jgi:hypothetical protein
MLGFGYLVALGCLAVSVIASALAQTAGAPLSEVEIRSLLYGNTMTSSGGGAGASAGTWDLYIAPNGDVILKGMAPNGSAFGDKGRATMAEGKLCIDWQRPRGDAPRCQGVAREGERYSNLNADGSVRSTYVVRTGNAARLD